MKPQSIVAGLVVLAAAVAAVVFVGRSLRHAGHEAAAPAALQAAAPETETAYIDVLPEVVELNNIATAEAQAPTQPRTLPLRGMLAQDPSRLVHVHARFPGQVVSLGMVPEPHAPVTGSLNEFRPVAFMDSIKEGMPLAVIWSKELGEKKSELVDGLTRLRVDRVNWNRLQALERQASVSRREVGDAQRLVELDEIAVSRARRTLQSWGLKEKQIAEVEAEAERIHESKLRGSSSYIEQDPDWAKVEILSPINGTVVEKNVALGDLVDTNADLFKVADLSTLIAWAHVYEEDLRYLHEIQRALKVVRWRITLNSIPSAPPIDGVMDSIGDILDSNEHMALVRGPVPNPNQELLAGQFITATVELPLEKDVVIIPTRALVEDGTESVVLVQNDPQKYRFTKRRVSVVRRLRDQVYLRSELTAEQRAQGLEELHPGERVVSAGALELKAALNKRGR